MKSLYGSRQFAEAFARGKFKIEGKAKIGRFNGRPVFDLKALAEMELKIDEWDKTRGAGRNRGLCRVEAA